MILPNNLIGIYSKLMHNMYYRRRVSRVALAQLIKTILKSIVEILFSKISFAFI